MMGQHAKFIARTVFVQNNNVEEACRIINRFISYILLDINPIYHVVLYFTDCLNCRIMGSEGWFDQYRRTRRYEKPFMV